MKKFAGIWLAGASVIAASPCVAQTAPASNSAVASADEFTLGEIVVTARRRTESLQEVPQTVNAVTADTLQKLNIKQFQDIQAVVPGLSASADKGGLNNTASLRGVSFNPVTGAPPTVAFYLNDAPVQLNFIFQSLFDIGQVEVLKGPQGTTRGVSAPSGAITVTTRKPDLSDFGGYGDVTLTDLQGRNVQAAVNVPVIKDVLAFRVAGVFDTNSADGVRSIHNALRPSSKTSAVRLGVSFEPSDLFNANITYQHLDNDLHSFGQVSGPGPGAFTLGTNLIPASVNPPLTPEMRASVQDSANRVRTHYDVVTAQLDSRIFGQHLSYVGSYQHQKVNQFIESGSPSPGDVGNILPGIAITQQTLTQAVETTHEFRIASDPAPGRFFDYTVGAYYDWFNPSGTVALPGPLLPGAFGTTPVIDLSAFNSAYSVPPTISIPATRQETSLFGSVTLHLPWNTELSGGIRHIWSLGNNQTLITTGNGLLNLGALGLPSTLPCSLLGATAGPGPGDCVLPTAAVVSDFRARTSETPNIYTVSLSHHFTRDFLVYANTGTAYRPPVASVGVQGQLANSSVPGLDTLSFHPAERSRTYEVGFKSTWLDGRARLNASLFRQRFSNLTISVPNIAYNNVNPGQIPAGAPGQPGVYVPSIFSFTASVDALVQGFDVDAAYQITRYWTVSAQMSYADGKVQGTLVPCNTPGPDGQAVFNTANLISLCPGGSVSRLPFWNATFQSEYNHPINERMDGFVRLLATYYPENKNRAEPDFTVSNYSLVNLYLGVRSHDGAWEASVFARNAFNARRALDISSVQTNLNGSLSEAFPQLIHPSGYYETTMTPQREVGVNLHYAWGSR